MSTSFTENLNKYRIGDKSAFDRLIPVIYKELHSLAQRHMKREQRHHTLQATALVNEAYLKLADAKVDWKDRAHFCAVASNIMRRILVDHARQKNSAKRGNGQIHAELNESVVEGQELTFDIIAVDNILKKLEIFDKRASRIFELHGFGGLDRSEIAEVEKISLSTVDRELKIAKAWVMSRMKEA